MKLWQFKVWVLFLVQKILFLFVLVFWSPICHLLVLVRCCPIALSSSTFNELSNGVSPTFWIALVVEISQKPDRGLFFGFFCCSFFVVAWCLQPLLLLDILVIILDMICLPVTEGYLSCLSTRVGFFLSQSPMTSVTLLLLLLMMLITKIWLIFYGVFLLVLDVQYCSKATTFCILQ